MEHIKLNKILLLVVVTQINFFITTLKILFFDLKHVNVNYHVCIISEESSLDLLSEMILFFKDH